MKKKREKIFLCKALFQNRKFDIFLRPDADESVVAEIFDWREYKAAEEIIRKSDLPILDVGAHIGVFSLYACVLNPAVKVYALEPERENFDLLLQNISANYLENVKACKVALAARSEEREIVLAPDSINHHLSSAGDEGAPAEEPREKVAATSLSDFLTAHRIDAVGLMKMDIEAGEYEVFENMTEEDFSRIRNIFLEYHDYGTRSHREIEKILRAHGFGVQIFPSRFESDLGFMLARNKRSGK